MQRTRACDRLESRVPGREPASVAWSLPAHPLRSSSPPSSTTHTVVVTPPSPRPTWPLLDGPPRTFPPSQQPLPRVTTDVQLISLACPLLLDDRRASPLPSFGPFRRPPLGALFSSPRLLSSTPPLGDASAFAPPATGALGRAPGHRGRQGRRGPIEPLACLLEMQGVHPGWSVLGLALCHSALSLSLSTLSCPPVVDFTCRPGWPPARASGWPVSHSPHRPPVAPPLPS